MIIKEIFKLRLIEKTLLTFFISTSLFNIANAIERREFNTKYFRIIYEADLEEDAAVLKEKADEIADRLFNLLDFKLEKRVSVILKDSQDENAYAAEDISIVIYPNILIRGEEPNYDSWIESVFGHELAHVAIQLMAPEIKIGPYKVYGALVPRFVHEGFATYIETELFPGGRGKSNFFNTIPKTFDKLNFGLFSRKISYSYSLGYSFINFFKKKYGEKKLVEKLYLTAGRGSIYLFLPQIHFSLDSEITDSSVQLSWDDYIESDWNSFIKRDHVTVGRILLDESVSQLKADQNSIYYVNSSGYLVRCNPSTLKKKKLVNYIYSYNAKPTVEYIQRYKEGKKAKLAAYVGRRYIDIENPKLFTRDSGSLAYISRKAGKEELILDGKVLIPKEDNLLFLNLSFHNGEIFFLAKEKYRPYSYLFTITDGKVMRVCRALDFSRYEDKIYITQEVGSKTVLSEIDINSMEMYKIKEASFLSNPARVGEDIYFLQYHQGDLKIYVDKISRSSSSKRLKLREYIPYKRALPKVDSIPYREKIGLMLPYMGKSDSFVQGFTNEFQDWYVKLLFNIMDKNVEISFEKNFLKLSLNYSKEDLLKFGTSFSVNRYLPSIRGRFNLDINLYSTSNISATTSLNFYISKFTLTSEYDQMLHVKTTVDASIYGYKMSYTYAPKNSKVKSGLELSLDKESNGKAINKAITGLIGVRRMNLFLNAKYLPMDKNKIVIEAGTKVHLGIYYGIVDSSAKIGIRVEIVDSRKISTRITYSNYLDI